LAIDNIDLTSDIYENNNALAIDLKNTELLSTINDSSALTSNSYLNLFILGFIGGLLALLTPCVFPMIPLTVSFFTNNNSKNNSKFNAITYGLFIIGIYLSLSIPFHFLDSINPEILNSISTNAGLNIFFFIVFVLFAFSFFGFYEITIPSKWVNSIDSKSNSIGGYIGIFFMALTLVLVSFSCTGPILGSLLVGSISSQGGAIQLTIGMLGFGVALVLCSPGVKKQNKVIAHIAVLLTFIILIALVGMRLPKSIEQGGLGLLRVFLMIGTSTFSMIYFIRSFISNRKAKENN